MRGCMARKLARTARRERSSTGPAGLNGNRSGDALVLGIRWAKAVNGDRTAQLKLEKVGDNGMRLRTTDKDPATGKNIVISEINLNRP